MEPFRKIASIMFADIQGYTAIMGQDEAKAMAMVEHFELVMTGRSGEHEGEVVNFYGDGCLSIYPNEQTALDCAIKIQQDFGTRQIPVRIGIHSGEVLIKNGNAYGDCINIASRIESLGQPGAVLLSEDVFKTAPAQNGFEFVKLDDFEFKNVAKPLGVYALKCDGLRIPDRNSITGKLKQKEDLERSIAVLPFENSTGRKQDQYIVEGISDEIRSQLLSIDSLKVISRSASVNYRTGIHSMEQIANELQVSHVLEGRVQIAGDNLKVNAELSYVATNKQIWSSPPITKKLREVFDLQNLIARQVIEELKLFLSNENRIQLQKVPTGNLEAYEYYQNGMALVHRGNGVLEELDQAVKCFIKATELDPDFLKGYLGLAEAYLEHIFWGRTKSNEVIEPATRAANCAYSLDDNSGEVYGVLGAIEFHKLQVKKSKEYLVKSIEMSPNFLLSHDRLAWVHIYNENFEEALNSYKSAIDLDPVSLKFKGDLAHAYYYSKHYDEGLDYINKLLDKYQNDPWFLWIKGYLHSGKGEFKEAVDSFLKRETSGKRTNWMLAYCLGKSGRTEEAESILDYHLSKMKFTHVPDYMIATIYSGLGRDREALKWLQRDLEAGGQGFFFVNLKHDPKFLNLRNLPEFKVLLDAVN